jgi:hypothetical protein
MMKLKSFDKIAFFSVAFASLMGIFVRFLPVFLSHFPLNDGGLFYTMAQDLLDHNFALPFYPSYNGSTIPAVSELIEDGVNGRLVRQERSEIGDLF